MRGFFLAPPGVALPGASIYTARQHNPCLATQGQIIVFPALFCQPSSLLVLSLRNSPQYQHERPLPAWRKGVLALMKPGCSDRLASRASCHTRGRSESLAGRAHRTRGRTHPRQGPPARRLASPVQGQAPASLQLPVAARADRAPRAAAARGVPAPRAQAGTAAAARGQREAARRRGGSPACP